jgi:hypothetical protein
MPRTRVVEEAEADHAREHGTIKAVKLGAGRHEGLHQLADTS